MCSQWWLQNVGQRSHNSVSVKMSQWTKITRRYQLQSYFFFFNSDLISKPNSDLGYLRVFLQVWFRGLLQYPPRIWMVSTDADIWFSSSNNWHGPQGYYLLPRIEHLHSLFQHIYFAYCMMNELNGPYLSLLADYYNKILVILLLWCSLLIYDVFTFIML